MLLLFCNCSSLELQGLYTDMTIIQARRISAAKLKFSLLEWDPQSQYEGHAQLIFRLKDQNGDPVEHYDIFFNSESKDIFL